jgi:hypothetical protein
MSETKEWVIDRKLRIRSLEKRRSDLWSVAGGSKHAVNVYSAFLDGRRKPATSTQAQAEVEGRDLMEEYRALLAENLAAHTIARAHAKAITDELRALYVTDKAAGRRI